MTSKSASTQQQSSGSNSFRLPRAKGLNRPTTWFGASSFGRSSSSSSGQSSTDGSSGPSRTTSNESPVANPFVAPFKSPFPSNKGKHKLSPSPSPHQRQTDGDFVMISPIRQDSSPLAGAGAAGGYRFGTTVSPTPSRLSSLKTNPMTRQQSSSSSSASTPDESPTPACGMATAAARLRLVDDSPIRRVPGQSRSLRPGVVGHDENDGEDEGPKNVFLDANGTKKNLRSPLKHSTTGLSDEEDSPYLAPVALMGGSPPPPPQPLFPLVRQSKSHEGGQGGSLFGDASRIPRLSNSHPLRARAGTTTNVTDRTFTLGDRPPTLSQKKAISLDQIHSSSSEADADALFGSSSHIGGHVRKARPPSSFGISTDGRSAGGHEGRAHKRINSADRGGLSFAPPGSGPSLSRSFGAKSLALSLTPNLGPLPDFSYSNSSISSLSTNNLTPPATSFSPAEPPIFEHIKPLQEVFEQENEKTVTRKFKPRDSGVSMGDEDVAPKPRLFLPPPASRLGPGPRRPAMLKRTSSMGDTAEIETPGIGPLEASGWPDRAAAFGFLGDSAMSLGLGSQSGTEAKPSMPGTPVKKQAFKSGVGHSVSQPTLGSGSFPGDVEMVVPLENSSKINLPYAQRKSLNMPLPSMKKPPPSVMKRRPGTAELPKLTFTTSSSPGITEDEQSPTVRFGGGMSTTKKGLKALTLAGKAKENDNSQLNVLRRNERAVSESEEEEGTPTKIADAKGVLAAKRIGMATPTPSPRVTLGKALPPSSFQNPGTNLMPRLSLPALQRKPHPNRTLNHRQSHPAAGVNQPDEEDLFETKFITLDTLGRGAFSTVVKVQDREGDKVWAVKKARGMFDGVRDRLRHLEEVDILRHLSRTPCAHVIRFEDAWEQNRQLYIQTELCLGSLAFFLEEYGRVVERLDEGRVWKCIRELSDGINHIHSNGVIHFDIKPANVLISATGSLKIGDFGLATRWPRVSPAEILEGAGLGLGSGNLSMLGTGKGKLEREGDRVYMAPEMLRGMFVMAADIFSFGLVVLEIATNICVPDGGAPWHALRENDFSVVDLSPLSPALCDLITQCMSANPSNRPAIEHIVNHPVVQRARNGKDALAPEDKTWLMNVLAGGFNLPTPVVAAEVDEDVVMGDA